MAASANNRRTWTVSLLSRVVARMRAARHLNAGDRRRETLRLPTSTQTTPPSRKSYESR